MKMKSHVVKRGMESGEAGGFKNKQKNVFTLVLKYTTHEIHKITFQ